MSTSQSKHSNTANNGTIHQPTRRAKVWSNSGQWLEVDRESLADVRGAGIEGSDIGSGAAMDPFDLKSDTGDDYRLFLRRR